MKKIILSLVIGAFSLVTYSQNSFTGIPYSMHPNGDFIALKKNAVNAKVPGTVHFSEDFDSTGSGARSGINRGIPLGWSVVNIAANSNNWIWSDLPPGGQYSTTIPAMNSTTGSNGYMLWRGDLFNTPFPPGGPVGADTYFVSDKISIPSAVNDWIIEFEHFQRYCCTAANELVVEVSNDSLNWKTIDATGPMNAKRGPNTVTPNGEVLRFIVSDTLGGQSQAWIRFRSTGNTHYFWMIDDVKLIEGNPNAIEIIDAEPVFSRNHVINPIYSQVPQFLMQPMEFDFEFLNLGSTNQNALTGYVDIYHDSTMNGQVGTGWRYAASQLSTNPIFPGLSSEFLTVDNPPYNNLLVGDFRINFDGSTSTLPRSSVLNEEYKFSVGDTVFAVDNGNFLGSAGPSSYVGGGQDGDRWAVLYENMKVNALATSISIYASGTNSVNASISPRIWKFNGNAATLNAAIVNPPFGSSPFSYTVLASDIDTWITLPLFPPVTLLADSQYVVGWEQTGGGSVGATFNAGRNREMEDVIDDLSNVAYLNDATPTWISPPMILGIRLNYGGLTVGGFENSSKDNQLQLFPNPSSGSFTINGLDGEDRDSKLVVRDVNGKMVYEEWIKGSSGNYNLEHLEKGVYFVTVVGGSSTWVERIVIY